MNANRTKDVTSPDQPVVTSGPKLFFCIDSCGDINEFERLHEAIKWADRNLDEERDDATDGWSEEVTNIRYGKILGGVVETSREPYDPEKEEHAYIADCSEVVEYAIKPIDESLDDFQILTDSIGCVRSLRTEFPEMEEKLTPVIDNLKRLRRASA
jgi:hypothetical protein